MWCGGQRCDGICDEMTVDNDNDGHKSDEIKSTGWLANAMKMS